MLWRDLQASSEQTQNLTFTQPKNGLEPISFDRSISLCIPWVLCSLRHSHITTDTILQSLRKRYELRELSDVWKVI
jgi:hypothetical protein